MSKGKHLTQEHKDKIIYLKSKGLKATEISKFMGISYSSANRVIKEFTNPPKVEEKVIAYVSDKEQQVLDSIHASKYYSIPQENEPQIIKQPENDEYMTSEMFLVCALLMYGAKLLYIDMPQGSKFANFYFEKNDETWRIVDQYHDNILSSPINILVSCYKQLKRAIYKDAEVSTPAVIKTLNKYINIYKQI